MAFKTTALRYLGGISGHGIVTQNGKEIAQATFDFDGYFRAARRRHGLWRNPDAG